MLAPHGPEAVTELPGNLVYRSEKLLCLPWAASVWLCLTHLLSPNSTMDVPLPGSSLAVVALGRRIGH